MAEAYTYNGVYGKEIKELYTPAGEAAEAYVYDGAAQQFWPTVDPNIPLVSFDADPVNGIRYKDVNWSSNLQGRFTGHNPLREVGSGAEATGVEYVQWLGSALASSEGWNVTGSGMFMKLEDPLPGGSPVALLTSPFDEGPHATDNPRYNLGAYRLYSRDDTFPFTERSPLQVNMTSTYARVQPDLEKGMYTVSVINSTTIPNNRQWSMPVLRFHKPDPVLIGEAVGTLAVNTSNINSDPYWIPDGGVVPEQYLNFENSEACTRLVLDKDFGSNESFFDLIFSRSPSVYGEDADSWLEDNVGLFRVTFERIEDNGFGLIPERWVYQDGVTTATSGGIYHNASPGGSNFKWYPTAGPSVSEYRITNGDKLRVRIYKYPY